MRGKCKQKRVIEQSPRGSGFFLKEKSSDNFALFCGDRCVGRVWDEKGEKCKKPVAQKDEAERKGQRGHQRGNKGGTKGGNKGGNKGDNKRRQQRGQQKGHRIYKSIFLRFFRLIFFGWSVIFYFAFLGFCSLERNEKQTQRIDTRSIRKK